VTRDQFLTEMMGERWHEWKGNFCTCGQIGDIGSNHIDTYNINFSTPEGFFKLWNFCKEQEWWEDAGLDATGIIFKVTNGKLIDISYIDPDTFANAIAKFRGWKDAF